MREGDIISLNVANRRLDVELSDSDIESRLAAWKTPAPRYTTGVTVKLPWGGGDGADHSSELLCQGFIPALGPQNRL